MKYRDVLWNTLSSRLTVPTPQGQRAITAMQQVMTYPLVEGYPIITERDLTGSWRKAIGELCAFINGATTSKEIAEFGCDWWGPWTTDSKTAKRGIEPGSLGPASYGGAFRHFPTPSGSREGFDQFANLVEQIRKYPDVRTHFITPWIPYWQVRGIEKSTIAPCHGWVHVRIINGEIHLHMFQRSGDVPVGVPHNMVQYAALIIMLSQLTGYRPGVYYHTISDAHVYEDQIPACDKMIFREHRRLPWLHLTSEGYKVTDIHEFRAEHFELRNYNPHPSIRIPVSV